ncbi:MAG: helix-turn-helix domain-containing protein, partial [Proteobacteria bacterium]|nr:helix-turn-helix domain-containing protein [Pseudomonadota bacterium]
EEIGAGDLGVEGDCGALAAPGGGENGASPAAEAEVAGEGRDEVERLRIIRALEQTRWNRSAAARNLGMTLRQLRYRLQKWGMD